MNLKERAIRALRLCQRHPTADQIGKRLKDAIKQFVEPMPINPVLAEHVSLVLRDTLGKLITEGRIYDGAVTRCEMVDPRCIMIDVQVVPNRSIERIVVQFNIRS